METFPNGKRYNEIPVAKVNFLGEHDGHVEQVLKGRLANLFQGESDVLAAFLAIISFETNKNLNVSLCLKSQKGPDKALLEKIAAIFSEIFNSAVHLDVLFLAGDQETELAKVCRPFFVRS